MKIFYTDIQNDRNTYRDNIVTKKDDYVITPEIIRDINVIVSFTDKCFFYVIQQRCIQKPVSNMTAKLFYSNS